MTDTALRSASVHHAAPRTRRGVLPIVLIGQFMAILDVSIVNVAGPTIRADLHASGAGLQLVIAGYTIAYAMLLITGARLGDIGGHRRAFLAGLGLFTAASLACGLAGGTGMLIAFRAVQGAGAALMVPQVLSLIQRGFTGAARARALSLYATVIAGGVVVGQIAGGALVSAHLFGSGWRPVFLVNVPIGVVLLAVGARVLPGDRGEAGRGLDPGGLVTLSAAVLMFIVPLVLGHEEHWPPWGWLCLAGSVLVFAAFVLIQRTRRTPLIPGRVVRVPGIVPAAGAIFGSMMTYGGFLFALALHLQGGLGLSPLRAGLMFTPGAVGFATASLNWRRLPARWHRPMIPVALVMAALGYAALGLTVRTGALYPWVLGAVLLVIGLGLGTAFSPLLTVALTHVPAADAADASGLLATVTQLAQVVGVATLGSLYLSVLSGPATSAHAEAVTCAGLAVVAVMAGGAAIPLRRSA
jgi:MFS family permease